MGVTRFMLASVVLGFGVAAVPLLATDLPKPTSSTEVPDIALPAELDRVLRDYERAWRAGDAAALAALFTEDGFILQSNRPPTRGRAAIRAVYESQGGAPLRLRALAFSAGDTIGYIIGAYGYGAGPGDTGKFTLTLRREPGGSWLIFSDMDNANAAPRRPNTPASAEPHQAAKPAIG
ncbi:MAG TPA: SgcJ/EcaC family oxidoreductase [Dokdonella sp.]|uniref:YybH family protein n=1 Tax=Dokdonella sp. TaxID=2291710 RepID=UPI002C270B48|nr:SgcJ/EcaC family oxidoreductase [Dokdonella sp.]HUD41162.1 SgcJ/EcaC family oxidoreductase [Dokdonella sp.]